MNGGYIITNMKLIVGLGNPGDKYKNNRHNMGFIFVDFLVKTYDNTTFKFNKYLLSDVAQIPEKAILAKPHTYMNKSGDAVKKIVERYCPTPSPLPPTTLIIAHDDLDIPFGKFKIQMQGPKQHNGLTDIQNKLRTMDFLRVRIGVDTRPLENRMNGEEFVLQDFTPEEAAALPELFKKISLRLEPFLKSTVNCDATEDLI